MLMPFKISILALATLCLVWAPAAGQTPAAAESVKVIDGASVAQTVVKPILRGPLTDSLAKPIAAEPVREDGFPDGWWKWIIIATLAFVGIGQLLILIFQTLTAGKTATAAKKAAEIAERMVTDFEAPFLFPVLTHTHIGEYLQQLDASVSFETSTPHVQFTIKNFGRTPALLQRATAVLFYGELDEARTDPTLGRVNELMLEPRGSLLKPLERKMSQPLSSETVESIKSGDTKIFLRGRITFLDVLGNRHEQTFCLAWDLEGSGFIPWGPHRNRRKRLSSKRRKLA